MELLPIQPTLEANAEFMANPDCAETLGMTIDFFQKIGYVPPWIGYYALENGQIVGSAAFKGAPKHGQVEIAYGTIKRFREQGVGARMCRKLVELCVKTDPSVVITARTLPEENFSTRILKKNSFILLGTVEDPEDGPVWEWKYNG